MGTEKANSNVSGKIFYASLASRKIQGNSVSIRQVVFTVHKLCCNKKQPD